MKLNKEQFKQFILDEVKQIALQEGWIAPENQVVSESENVAEELPVISESTEPAKEVAEEPKIEIAEVKRLAEEFTRMKELVDFRSPLLKKENQ